MKKIFLFITLAAISVSASAQSIEKLIAKYEKSPNVQAMTLTKDMISMMAGMAQSSADIPEESREQMEILKDIDGMTTLTEENIDEQKGNEFLSELKSSLTKGWEIITEAEEDGENVVVAAKKKKAKDKHYTEVVVGAVAEGNMVLVYITGKISEENIGNVVQMGK